MTLKDMIKEASESWESNFGKGEKDFKVSTVEEFGIYREGFLREWVWNVYGVRI
jgi:hypothetical protein